MAVPRRCLMWPSPSPDPTADPRRTAALPDVAMSPPKIHIYRGSHFDLDRQHPRRSGRTCRRGYGIEDLSYRHHRAWEAEWPIR